MGSRWRFTGVVALWMTVMHAGAYGLLAAQVPSGTWAPAANMAEARSGASAALLQDGSVLIAGGAKDGEPLESVEIFNRGAFSATGSMLLARKSAAAVTLKDGRVLIAGGSTSTGPTSETELYNPATRSWTIGDSMLASRSGHTATLLADGRVLIAGGEGLGAPGSTLEIFNPATSSFSLAGTLATPRKNHAAVLLSGGRVMIAGGFDGSHILKSTEIFDPATKQVSSGPSLSTARMGHSATRLLNGDVLVAGGSDGSRDLASAELYSAIGTSANASSAQSDGSTSARNMLSARSGHSAFLLPHNAAVLMVGGSSASAELYQAWNSAFIATGSPATPRSGAAGTPLAADGLLLLAGGETATAELYGFPTIKTDKDDYRPGVRAIITGGGWAPGEAVTLVFVEVPQRHPAQFLKLTADASGNLYYDQWAPERHDVGVRFYVTAAGSLSGSQAQMTFTDGDITWNGNVSTDWSDASNWSGGVPGASDKAINPAGRPLYPILTGNKKSVGSLQIDSGASVTVSSDLDISTNSSTADSVVISGTLNWTGGVITLAGPAVSLTVDSGGVFKLNSGTNGFPAFATISLDANSTVEYGGANQTIKVDSVLTTYGHLKTSGTGTKTWSGNTSATITGNLDVGGASTLTLGGNITVNGNLSIGTGTTLDVSSLSWNITLKGNWTNNGTFNPRGSGATVTLNGSTAQQTIGGTTACTFISLAINNTSGYGVRLSQSATVKASLSLISGIIDAATDNTTLKMAWSGSLSQSSSPPYVVGKFAREYSSIGTKTFPVGKGGNYRPVKIQFTTLTGVSTTSPATITVEQFESDIPGGAAPGTALLGSRYWHVSQSGGTGQVYNITLDGTGTSPTSPVKILKGDGGTPVAFTASGTAPNYTVTGLTSFSDFALAQNANPTSLAVTSATGTYGGTTDLSATLTSSGSPLSGKAVSFTLNGTAKGSAKTDDNGVATLTGASLAGINAGTYSTGVGASFAADTTYDASSGSNSLTVNKATATIVEVDNLSQIYDGTPKSPTAVTDPAGLDGINFTYNGSSTAPTNAGSYAIVASLNNVNYTASDFTSATLVIGKATATITPGNLTQTYDGSPKSATVTTSPAGLSGVSITYDGSATAPTNAGSYAVVASLNNANYTATDATGTLTINKAASTITLSNLTHQYDGSPNSATATTSPAGLSGVSSTDDDTATLPSNYDIYAVVAPESNTN